MYPLTDEYPKRLEVRGKRWTVEFSDQPIIYQHVLCRGLSCPVTRVITLDLDISPRLMFRTFCHEICHALEFEYELRIPHALIYALERPIASFVYQNFFKQRCDR